MPHCQQHHVLPSVCTSLHEHNTISNMCSISHHSTLHLIYYHLHMFSSFRIEHMQYPSDPVWPSTETTNNQHITLHSLGGNRTMQIQWLRPIPIRPSPETNIYREAWRMKRMHVLDYVLYTISSAKKNDPILSVLKQ